LPWLGSGDVADNRQSHLVASLNERVGRCRRSYYTDEFVLQRSIATFDGGNGPVLFKGANAGLDLLRAAPEFVFAESGPYVADDGRGSSSANRECQVAGVRHLFDTGRFSECH